MAFKNNFRFLSLNQAFFNAAIRFYTADLAAFWADEKVGPTLDITYPHYQQLDLDAMLAWFSRMPDIDVSEQLSNITAPTLVIHGKEDPIVPFAQGQLIAEMVANGRLVALDGCGHLPMGERGEQYEVALVSWWREMLKHTV